jgi:hypothetical protein
MLVARVKRLRPLRFRRFEHLACKVHLPSTRWVGADTSTHHQAGERCALSVPTGPNRHRGARLIMVIYLDTPTSLHWYAPLRPWRQRLNPARQSSVVKPVILPDILNVPPKGSYRCFSALYKADPFFWTCVQSSWSALCPKNCWSFPNDNMVAVGNYRELHSRQSLALMNVNNPNFHPMPEIRE